MTDKQIKVGQIWSTRLLRDSNVRIEEILHNDNLFPILASRLNSGGAIYETVTYTRHGSFLESGDDSPYDLLEVIQDAPTEQASIEGKTTDSPSLIYPVEDVNGTMRASAEAQLNDYRDRTGELTQGIGQTLGLGLAASERTTALCVGDDTDYTNSKVLPKPNLRIKSTANGWLVSDAEQYMVGQEWVFNNPCKLAEFIHDYFTTEEVKED